MTCNKHSMATMTCGVSCECDCIILHPSYNRHGFVYCRFCSTDRFHKHSQLVDKNRIVAWQYKSDLLPHTQIHSHTRTNIHKHTVHHKHTKLYSFMKALPKWRFCRNIIINPWLFVFQHIKSQCEKNLANMIVSFITQQNAGNLMFSILFIFTRENWAKMAIHSFSKRYFR